MRASPLASAALFLLFPAAGPLLFAHGGIYRSPTSPEPSSVGSGPYPGGPPVKAGPARPRRFPDWRNWWALSWEGVLDMRIRMARAALDSRPQDWKEIRPLSPKEKRELILPVLSKALGDPNPEVREAAVVALGKLALPETAALVRKAMKDRIRPVRNAAVLAAGLGRFRSLEGDLLKLFRPGVNMNETRCWAAVGLGYLGTDRAVDALLAQLERLAGKSVRGSSAEVTACCAAGLSVSRSRRAAAGIAPILAQARSRRPAVQGLLRFALGKLKARKHLPLVLGGLGNRNPLIRLGAAAGLGSLAPPGDRSVLGELFCRVRADKDLFVRAASLISIGRIGGSPAVRFLEARLRKKPGLNYVCLEPFTALALGLTGERKGARCLLSGLTSGAVERKGAFALALGMLGGPVAGEALVQALGKNRNSETFAEIALAAGMARAKEALPRIERILSKERRLAFLTPSVTALGLLGFRKEAMDLLLSFLSRARSARLQGPLVFALSLLAGRKEIPRVGELVFRKGVQDQVRALCCAALGNLGDHRRHPVLSEFTKDFPLPLATPVIREILYLF